MKKKRSTSPARKGKKNVTLAKVASNVTVLKKDVAVLKKDVSTLKTDVSALKSDVSILKTDVASLKIDMSTLREEMLHTHEAVMRHGEDIQVWKDEIVHEFHVVVENLRHDLLGAFKDHTVTLDNARKDHEQRIVRLELIEGIALPV